jgi:AcrR family transcriptional regulator
MGLESHDGIVVPFRPVSIPYEVSGRTEQKQRTRGALLASARELVAAGITPTVEQAASTAGISRTTAYRYFPNQRALLMAAHPETAAQSLLPTDPPADPAARLDAVVEAFTDLIVATEAQQRTMLRLSLEADDRERAALPLRQGRAIAWIEEALSPLRGQLSDPELHKLALAIRSAAGIEALVWLTDVAGLDREEASHLIRWSAQSLLHAALTSRPPSTA